jgi:hypothetical protein
MTADELFARGQATGMRLQREAAERREQGASAEPAPHVRKRLPKGCQVHVFTCRLTVPTFLFLAESCRRSGSEMNILVDALIRRAAGLPELR